jgi:hypothetical protein
MLVLLNSQKEKATAQKQLENTFKSKLKNQGKRKIGFRVGGGGTNPILPMYSNGSGLLWFSTTPVEDEHTPRYWNATGIFDPSKAAQAISVELNIATKSNQQVSGYFAKDIENGYTYLLHSGRLGGGKPGIGKSSFLAWSKQSLTSVQKDDGKTQWGILLGRIDEPSLLKRVEIYVRLVAEFKELATKNQLNDKKFLQYLEDFEENEADSERFNKEFFGRKKGKRKENFDYITKHGDIVNTLYKELLSKSKKEEIVFNTKLVDVGVKISKKLVEIYEVKPRITTQNIYTALGQLLIHSKGEKQIKKILVLPEEENLSPEIERILSSLGIEILTFYLTDDDTYKFNWPSKS